MLVLLGFNLPFVVATDASVKGLRAAFSDRPIAYESRRFNPAEIIHTKGEQEILAVVHAWGCCLEGLLFTVVTDHNPLTHMHI